MLRCHRLALASALSVAPLFVAGPARADVPSLGPQFNVAPQNYSPYGFGDENPAIATNGTDALLCWQGVMTPSYAKVVFCARYTASGDLLDKDAIVLSIPGGNPSVFWDGAKYVVVSSIQSQRLDPATGALEAPLAVDTPPTFATAFANAWGAGKVLQVQAFSSSGWSGKLMDTATGSKTFILAMPAYSGGGFSVGYSGGVFLLTWASAGVVRGVRISPTGAVLDTTPIVIDAGHSASSGGALAGVSSPSVASSPSGFLVSWTDQRSGAHDVYAARVGADGSVTDSGGLLIAGNSGDGLPSATWTGSDWWIAWNVGTSSSFSVLGATLETDGTVGAVLPLGTGASSPSSPAIAATSSTLFGAWNGWNLVLGGRFDTQRAALDGTGVPLSSHLAQQLSMRLASSDAGYLVSWYEPFADPTGKWSYIAQAMRLGVDGTLIDTTPAPLFQNTSGVHFLAAMGSTYVVAYHSNGIQLSTLPDNGTAAFTPLVTIPVNTGGYYWELLGLACMSDRCAVVWQDNDASNTQPTYAVVVKADGTVTPKLSLGHGAYLAVAGSDGNSFLVFTNGRTMTPIAADGTAGATVSSPLEGPIAWGTDRYLLMSWDGGGNTMSRWTAGGTMIGAQEPAPAFAQKYLAGRVAWDGRAFLAFQDKTAAEVPADAPSTGLATFSLFNNATVQRVASAAPHTALALGADPQGGWASPRAVARIMSTPDVVDAGAPDGGDGGAPDAGSLDAGDAGEDAGPADDAGEAGAPTDDAGEDAGPAGDAGEDAAMPVGSTDAGDDAEAMDAGALDSGRSVDAGHDAGRGGSPDAGVPDASMGGGDGGDGGAHPGGVTDSGGCGCRAAGTTESSPALAGLGAAGAVAVWLRRRRRARVLRA